MKKLLSISEVAGQLGLSERALRQRVARGEFPARRWGSKVIIVASELEEFLRQLAGTSAEDALRKCEQKK